jgi:hypothetical protein
LVIFSPFGRDQGISVLSGDRLDSPDFDVTISSSTITINLKTAKALGIELPPTVLARARRGYRVIRISVPFLLAQSRPELLQRNVRSWWKPT